MGKAMGSVDWNRIASSSNFPEKNYILVLWKTLENLTGGNSVHEVKISNMWYADDNASLVHTKEYLEELITRLEISSNEYEKKQKFKIMIVEGENNKNNW